MRGSLQKSGDGGKHDSFPIVNMVNRIVDRMASLEGMIGALQRFPQTVEHRGLTGGVKQWAGLTYLRATRQINGESIFSRDWDLLVVLDACRADLLSAAANSYDFIGDVDTFPSLGSCTASWMEANFRARSPSDLSRTGYVCANPFSQIKIDDGGFRYVDHVWQYAWDDDFGGVRPRPVTDRAIKHGRTGDVDKLLVHYLQPHLPFKSELSEGLKVHNFSGDHRKATPGDWVRIQRGERDPDVVWKEYRETLEWVLDDVALLSENIDAETAIITADHGNACGEFGVYGHPCRTALSCLTDVPWASAEVSDEETHVPQAYDTEAVEFEVESRLKDLGYL